MMWFMWYMWDFDFEGIGNEGGCYVLICIFFLWCVARGGLMPWQKQEDVGKHGCAGMGCAKMIIGIALFWQVLKILI